jgi:3-hydroxyisobutyrate dehydrogenase
MGYFEMIRGVSDMNTKNKSIGFLGLGNMGYPIARNLLKAGYKLNVCDVNRVSVSMLEKEGGSGVESPLAIVEALNTIITMLSEPSVIEKAYLGSEGIFEGARKDTIIINTSTTSPGLISSIVERAKETGTKMLDAPVVGAPPIAAAGKLIFLA